MFITIEDDFDLEKIKMSGQCFRVKEQKDGWYRFITGDDVLYIRKDTDTRYEVSCDEMTFRDVWHPYFDLDRNYEAIRQSVQTDSEYILEAMKAGKGIRVLRQDPWETLITFILSQRKSIPAIANNVETIARLGGHLIETDRESLFSFPTPREFMRIEMGMLKAAGVGYRLPYICDARDKVISGEIDLIAMEELSDEGLFDTLKTIYGVGNKIANCVCLYAYGRIARVPIDTWIRKVINNTCEGRNPFPGFGDVAGVIQQYVFYTEQMRKRGMWMIEIEDSASCRASAEADAGDIEEPVG